MSFKYNTLLIIGFTLFNCTSLIAMERIAINKMVMVMSDGRQIVQFAIPDGLAPSEANADTRGAPGIPLLIQCLVARDFHSANKLITNQKANVNIQEWRTSDLAKGKSLVTPLMAVIGSLRGNTDAEGLQMLQRLLAEGADVTLQDGIGFTALHYAVNNSKISQELKRQVIEMLGRAAATIGKKVSPQYGTALDLAKRLGLNSIQPDVYALLSMISSGAKY